MNISSKREYSVMNWNYLRVVEEPKDRTVSCSYIESSADMRSSLETNRNISTLLHILYCIKGINTEQSEIQFFPADVK